MSEQTNQPQDLPDYTNPPLSEVACGVSFEPLESMRIPHIGLFWQAVRDEFPITQHAAPLGDFQGAIDMADMPIPRVWLISQSENSLIQIQNDRFIFNWRRVSPDDIYPRYEYVIESFRKYFELFLSFVESNDLGEVKPTEGELTYINQIPQGEGWQDVGQIGNIMNDISWAGDKKFLPPPDIINCLSIFTLPDGSGKMNVSIQPAKRRTDETRIFLMELSCKGLKAQHDLSQLWSWYELAHAWIVKGFEDLTQNEIQQKTWKKK